MFKFFKNRYGQAIFAEYAITFFMVVGIILAMGTLIKRSIQGRMFSTHAYVFRDVNAVYGNPAMDFQGGIWAQYEPYYSNAETTRSYTQRQETGMLPGGRDGIVEYIPRDTSRTRTIRDQASAEFAD